METSLPSSSSWNIKILVIPPMIMALLLLSWVLPITRPLWDAFDQRTFEFLNSWVQKPSFWQNFWAFNGSAKMDWIHDLVMFLFCLIPICFTKKEERMQKVAHLLFIALFLALIISLINGLFLPDFIHIRRESPTAADPTAFRLKKAISWIKVKDRSYKSFPGDHGTTAFVFAHLIFYLMGKRAGALALFYAIFFSLPRLIAGAHWMTDIALGSVSIASLSTSIAFGTPLATFCLHIFERGLDQTRRIKHLFSPLKID